MLVIPAIDIKDSRCVSLVQGNFEDEIIYSNNPVYVAKRWEERGAKMLHIVNLDGARLGFPQNTKIIKNIIEQINIPIQIGGGIRSFRSVQNLIEMGYKRIVLGTIVLENQPLLKELIAAYGEKIVVSLDIKGKKLMKKGWLESSRYNVVSLIKQIEGFGVKTIIYTDTLRDGTLTEPNYINVESLRKIIRVDLIIAGGISSIDHIKKLKEIGVNGVIIGKALYEGKINLEEAIRYAN